MSKGLPKNTFNSYQTILLVMKYVDWSGTIIGESYFLFMDFKTFLTARI